MDSVEKVKSRLGIVEVVGSYLDLKKSGKNYSAICPFHSEDTPSFMVSPELGIYKCFGCGASGDIFTFVQEMEGIDFYSALKKLADKAGVELEEAPKSDAYKFKKRLYLANEKAADFYNHLLLKHKAGKKGLDYLLKKRGLKKEVIKEFKLGYAPKNWDLAFQFLTKQGFKEKELSQAGLILPRKKGEGYIDKFRGRVLFPLIDTTNKIQGFMGRTVFEDTPKYLNTSDTPIFNKSAFIYGLNHAKVSIKKKGALLVEGPMDVLSAFQHGIKNVVAPLGTSLTTKHLKTISRYTKDVTFCFDSDSAGLEAIKRAVLMAEKMDLNIKVVLIPRKYKDLDEVLKKEPDLTKDLLASSVSAYDFFIAYALRKYDKNTAAGKKAIVKELAKVFSSTSGEITLEHYTKKLSKELDLSEKAIYSVFSSEVSVNDIDSSLGEGSSDVSSTAGNLEQYFLSLLLKAPLISEIEPFLDLHKKAHFDSVQVGSIFAALRDYINEESHKKLDIKAFIDTIDESLREFAQNLYLQGTQDLEEINYPTELEKVSNRLEKKAARKQIEALRKQLSLAEMEGNYAKVKEITTQVKEFSKKLI